MAQSQNIAEMLRTQNETFFKISLAQWSLHKTLFDKKLDNLDFPAKTKNDFGISAVEYVNQFFKDKAEDTSYLKELNTRAADVGVENVLIMIDGEGHLALTDDKKRNEAVENHHKWVEAAKYLGCHSIRVNAYSTSESFEDAKLAAIEGLGKLAEFAKPFGINVIVENHGGFSSNGKWLSQVMKAIDTPNCGTLPDFGNFCIKRTMKDGQRICEDEYDRYKGVKQLMPYAKGVSAKSYAFDANGDETTIDFLKMLKIVKKADYTGHIGIEFEGSAPEDEGIMATKKLLDRLGGLLSG
jgi:sugar phosphate isomerase/epimerase